MSTTAPSSQSPVLDLKAAVRDKDLLVLDYDGTLAYLDVDWAAVRSDLSETAAGFGFRSAFRPLWGEIGRCAMEKPESLASLFEVLRGHESRGVESQRPRREVVDAVSAMVVEDSPQLAVFSTNLHETVARGLTRLGLSSIGSIVGADDVNYWKPDPDGLYRLLAASGVSREKALFAGDSERDAQAAQRAGVEFIWL